MLGGCCWMKKSRRLSPNKDKQTIAAGTTSDQQQNVLAKDTQATKDRGYTNENVAGAIVRDFSSFFLDGCTCHMPGLLGEIRRPTGKFEQLSVHADIALWSNFVLSGVATSSVGITGLLFVEAHRYIRQCAVSWLVTPFPAFDRDLQMN